MHFFEDRYYNSVGVFLSDVSAARVVDVALNERKGGMLVVELLVPGGAVEICIRDGAFQALMEKIEAARA